MVTATTKTFVLNNLWATLLLPNIASISVSYVYCSSIASATILQSLSIFSHFVYENENNPSKIVLSHCNMLSVPWNFALG